MRLLLSLAITLALALPSLGAEKKNVLLLVADDLGMQVGCYGDTSAKRDFVLCAMLCRESRLSAR